jgi:DMSO reductase family type II enzyme heme b subunit
MAEEAIRIEVSEVTASLDALLAPDAGEWEGVAEAVVPVEPTPLERLPSAYVQVSWKDRPRSALSEVRVRAAASGSGFAVRLDWPAARPSRLISDVNVFADGCAMLFPANGGEVDFGTMGSPEAPVGAWHWRAGTEVPFSATAAGIGTVERAKEHEVQVRSRWSEGVWQVVLSGPVGKGGVPLQKGRVLPVAFAVWSGSSRERGGLKSYSPQRCELRV